MMKWIRDALLVSLITLASIEVALRIAPSVIPLGLLIRFSPNVRAEIAERRDLATVRRTVQVPRDDGGPPLRVFPPHQKVNRLFADPDAVESVTTDETGFCNVPLENEAKREVGFVAVGDSFTWCTAVRPQDAWVSRLAQLTGVGGYNLGLGGVGVYEYLQILATYGLRLRPRLVFLNYYEGNDLRDALGYQQYLDRPRNPDEGEMKSAGVSELEQIVHRVAHTPIVDNSYALNLALASGIEIYAALNRACHADRQIDFRYQLAFPGGRTAFNLHNTDTDEVEHARALRDGRISLTVLEKALERFVELADQHGFEPVVLYTPSAYTAYADYVEFEDRDLDRLMPWFSRTQRDFLQSRSQALGYRFVDLTPALRQAAREHGGQALLYFPTNMHFSPLGNEVVARELADVFAGQIPHPPDTGSPNRSNSPRAVDPSTIARTPSG